ncbi:MAG: tetratricopeptide repeat protein [Cyanobacteria bacterium]|nr:tetratricopeptide repeat protein [Cyanobacteria bacterium CG_2015-16_32_12]NCO78591.1 tetratricopeptide repeat protein [Cyanobacteria bacterium CG_2015-22_32_23]NCQ02983.1 tetratricopeptide repeat protein [Cyanobacteria bacterium CG_2015-09_32_10]NCQ40388.1 tetratricopeptide repeat protein [Cyanobacteria bacterium CG_2015-04_32_10]NCS83674.1 tetratricopeptide repeat protein [Cyanobacteria bacterium CG_2015-02_32_10]
MKKLRQWLKFIPATIQAHDPLDDDYNLKEENSSLSSQQSVKDSDLEFLFQELLKGVANGKQESYIEQFFENLQPKITVEIWLDWLQRYRNQLISSSAPHYNFAARMIILGEKTASLPFLRAVGDLAYEIGKELLNRSSFTDSLPSHVHQDSTVNNINHDDENSQPPVSFGDVLSLLQEDSEFAENTARQWGMDTLDPGMIINKIVEESELNSPVISSETVKEWFNLGLKKAEEGNLEDAIAFWDRVLKVDPQQAQTWHNRGSALAYLNRFEEAVTSFDHAIALNVNYYQSWNDRGNALYSLQRWQEAIISWDRVLGIQPDYSMAWYSRGLALEKLNLFSEAISSYQKCLSIDHDHNAAHNALIRLLSIEEH